MSANSCIGLGIVGCGAISRHHIRLTQDDERLRWVAACDVNEATLEERAEEFDIPGRYTSTEDLLADPAVDAVVVATPPPAHLKPTLAAFEAGKHVLVEKPIGLNAGEVHQMMDAQSEGLVGACCSSRFRSTATARRAAEIVQGKELGEVRRLVCTALAPPPEKLDGPLYLYKPNWGALGYLGDWGCYDLDFLLGICGWSLQPETCLADTVPLHELYAKLCPPIGNSEIQFSAKFRFDDGVVFDFRRATYFAGTPRNEWLIECERGTLELAMTQDKPPLTIHRYAATGIDTSVEIEEPNAWSVVLAGPVLDFVGAILEGRPPHTTLANSLVVQRMTDAVYASAKSGCAVSLV